MAIQIGTRTRMANRIGTRTRVVARSGVRLPVGIYVAAAAASVLIVLLMLAAGPGRVVWDGLSLVRASQPGEACVVETTYEPTATTYVPVSVLVCWDLHDNLQVPSPERHR